VLTNGAGFSDEVEHGGGNVTGPRWQVGAVFGAL
jgi:hypothetical protein